MLQSAIAARTLDEELEEIVVTGHSGLSSSEEIDALYERLNVAARAVDHPCQEKVAFDTERSARNFAVGHAGEDRYDDWLSMPLTAPADEEEEEDGTRARMPVASFTLRSGVDCDRRSTFSAPQRGDRVSQIAFFGLGSAAASPVVSHQPAKSRQSAL